MNKTTDIPPDTTLDLNLTLPTACSPAKLPGIAARAANSIVSNMAEQEPDLLAYLAEHLLAAAILTEGHHQKHSSNRKARVVRQFLRSMLKHSGISLRVSFTA